MRSQRIAIGILSLVATLHTYSQTVSQPQASEPDVLTCKDGEKFIGQLISSSDKSVVFKSDSAGQVTVDWSKIQDLRSAGNFAVLPKGLKLHGASDQSRAPQGKLSATNQQIEVNPGAQTAPQTLAVTNVAQVVAETAFQRAFQRRNIFQAWNGGASAGIAYTNSTQKSQSYTTAVTLTRAIPSETWLDQRSRTLLNLNQAYGKITQPGTPASKTSILHFGLEQDWYLNPRLFAFGQALLDHNYSEGLDLQQDYGAGLGFVLIKRATQELDAKASIDYVSQRFAISTQNKNLIASTFGETYVYHFKHGIVFNELGTYIPAWNVTSAYSAVVNANLTFPVYRRIGFTAGGIDNYLNDPPAGFKKNSFTLTLGATYIIQ